MMNLLSSRPRLTALKRILQLSGGESSKARFLPLAGWRAYSPCFGKQFVVPFPQLSTDLYHSEESERVSELKSVSGSSKLPYGTLALGAEGIKDAIKGFDDAYASIPCPFPIFISTYVHDHTPLQT